MVDRMTLGKLLTTAKHQGRGMVLNAQNQQLRRIEKSGLIYKPKDWFAQMAVGRSGLFPRTAAQPTVEYTQLCQMFRNSVYICSNAIADKVASIGIRVNRVRSGKLGPVREHVSTSHPLYELMQEPYPRGTLFDFLYQLTVWLQICGDAYFRKHRNVFLIPDRLELLSPQWVKIIPSEETFIHGSRVNTLYLGTESYDIDRNDMVHIQKKNPDWSSTRRFYGLSTCIATESTIQLEQEMYNRLRHKTSNFAKPGLIFGTKKRLNDVQMTSQINAIMNQHRLAEHEGRPMLLHDEMELLAGGDGAQSQELDFRGSLEDTLKLTAGAFGVPLAVVGMVGELNKANAEAALSSFAQNKLNPLLTQISQTLTNQLAHDFDPDLEIQIGPFEVRDYKEMVNAMQVGSRIGAITSNEMRDRMFNLPPLEVGGDQVMLPAGVLPGTSGNQPGYGARTASGDETANVGGDFLSGSL